uniref:Myosin motor domain-containing protein n=1 Tax=Syphacia muris TaxID=451379 RepID=A0A0N5ALA5_9BILA
MQMSAFSPSETVTVSCFNRDKLQQQQHQPQQHQIHTLSTDISPQSLRCLSYATSTPLLNTPQNDQLHQIRQEIDHLSERLSSLRDQFDCNYDFSVLSSASSLLTIPPPPPPVHHALSSSALTSLALTKNSTDSPPEIPPRTYRRKTATVNAHEPYMFKSEPLDTDVDVSMEKDLSEEVICASDESSDDVASEWQTVAKINFNLLRRSNCSFINEISKLYANQTCWFELGPVTCFLNPYNDVLRKKHVNYTILTKILDQALESTNANVVVMGDCGSGRSYITEQLAELLCERTTVYNSPLRGALHAALIIQRTFHSGSFLNDVNRTSTSASYEFYVIRGSLDRINVTHLKSLLPNVNCLPFLLSHFVEGMRRNEKEKYFLADFESLQNASNAAQIQLNPIRQALKTLDIAFEDVMRIIAASFLLSRVQFSCIDGQIDILHHSDLENAAILLGVSSLSLYKIFTRRTIKNKFGTLEVSCSTDTASLDRDILVQNLLSECIIAIIRRVNTVLQTEQFSASTDSHSIRNDSGISISNKPFLARIILYDTISFKSSSNDFDAFCVNFAAEKWRALYKEKIMSRLLPDDVISVEQADINATLIDFTAPVNYFGCFVFSYMHFQWLKIIDSVIVRHYDETRPVAYDCKQFISKNKNKLPDGMIDLFSKTNCSFPFASHLFMNRIELQHLLPATKDLSEQKAAQMPELQYPSSLSCCLKRVFNR